jgi:alanine dehydrogenase
MIESKAGNLANYKDNDYSEAGAEIVYSHQEAFKADMVLKVEPPTDEEIGFLLPGKTLVSALQTINLKRSFFEQLNSKKVTAIAYELLEDNAGSLPAVRAMSEIAGSTSVLIAAEYLISSKFGKGIVLGGITGVPPARVVILGAGTVGEYAARAALGLGVDLQIFDDHIYKLRRIKQALGQQVFTSTLQPEALHNSLRNADVVIGALRNENEKNRFIISREIISQMAPGSVIIDVSIDQGGCFETSRITTHENPVYTEYGIIHYCVPNIASRFAKTASDALSNIFTPIILQIADAGGIEEMIFGYQWFMKGVYTYKGFLTNTEIAEKTGIRSRDLRLLIAARF